MGINRRNFFRALGATGAAIAVGKEINAEEKNESLVEFFRLNDFLTRVIGKMKIVQ